MNGNFQNKNNKGRFKKVYLIVGVVVLLGMCFSISYLITDWITNPKDNTSDYFVTIKSKSVVFE